MSEQGEDGRRLWLMVLMALWLAAWVVAIMQIFAQPTGDSFTRGLNRVTGFLGWQGVAGMIALAIWGVGRGFPKGSGTRRISAVPLGMALAILLAVLGIVLWARAG